MRGADGPWQRLVWSLPVALVITTLAVAGFIAVLAQAPRPPMPRRLAMWVVELPPEPRPPAVSPPTKKVPTPSPNTPPTSPKEPQPKRSRPAPQHKANRLRPQPRIRPEPQPPARTAAPAAPLAQAHASLKPSGGVTMGARALYKPIPEIPDELRHRHLSLVAVARFRVAADGSANVNLIQPTPEPRLNTAVIETLQKWRFFPAMEDGRPIASTIDIRIPIEVQ
jgi:protein TonB